MLIFLCTFSKHVSWSWPRADSISVKIMWLEKLCPKVFLWHLEKKEKQSADEKHSSCTEAQGIMNFCNHSVKQDTTLNCWWSTTFGFEKWKQILWSSYNNHKILIVLCTSWGTTSWCFFFTEKNRQINLWTALLSGPLKHSGNNSYCSQFYELHSNVIRSISTRSLSPTYVYLIKWMRNVRG